MSLCGFFCATQLWILTLIWHWCCLWGTEAKVLCQFPCRWQTSKRHYPFWVPGKMASHEGLTLPKCHMCAKDEGTKVGILHLKEWPWPPAQWWLGPGHSSTLAHQSKFFPNLNKKTPALVLEDLMRLLFFAMHSDFIVRQQVQWTDATGLLLISLGAQLVGQSLPASETRENIFRLFKFTQIIINLHCLYMHVPNTFKFYAASDSFRIHFVTIHYDIML